MILLIILIVGLIAGFVYYRSKDDNYSYLVALETGDTVLVEDEEYGLIPTVVVDNYPEDNSISLMYTEIYKGYIEHFEYNDKKLANFKYYN